MASESNRGEYEFDLDIQLLTCIEMYEEARERFWTEEGAPAELGRSAVLYQNAEEIANVLQQMAQEIVLHKARSDDFDAFRCWAGEHILSDWHVKLFALAQSTNQEFARVQGNADAIDELARQKIEQLRAERANAGASFWDDIMADPDALASARPQKDSAEKLVWERLCIELASKGAKEMIPAAVNRFFVMAGLLQDIRPSARTARFLSRVARCFVWGFYPECQVMCRSALDAEFGKVVPDKMCEPGPGGRVGLYQRINGAHAQGWLSKEAKANADAVRKIGNDAIHDDPEQAQRCVEIIRKMLRVLKELDRAVRE